MATSYFPRSTRLKESELLFLGCGAPSTPATCGTGAAASESSARARLRCARAHFTAPLGATKFTRSSSFGCISARMAGAGCHLYVSRPFRPHLARAPGSSGRRQRNGRLTHRQTLPFPTCSSGTSRVSFQKIMCSTTTTTTSPLSAPLDRPDGACGSWTTSGRGSATFFCLLWGGGCVTFTTGDFRHPPKSQDLPRARAIEFRACA